jgi:hypothetical protein
MTAAPPPGMDKGRYVVFPFPPDAAGQQKLAAATRDAAGLSLVGCAKTWTVLTDADPAAKPSRAIAAALGLGPARQSLPELLAAGSLRNGIDRFTLDLRYVGPQDKPFYQITLMVQPVQDAAADEFYPAVQITAEQAGQLIDHLLETGFFARSDDIAHKRMPIPKMPCYTLWVGGGSEERMHQFFEDLGWGWGMMAKLEALRPVMEGDSGAALDKLLGRLAGFRPAWAASTRPAKP